MKEIHLICNAHIDPIWQWDWQEGVSATLSTFQSAVNLAEEFDYIFCHNEVTVYKYVEEYAPSLFERIQELVKAGKWHIMGGWYLQPDCNMPSGESIIRQIQEGRRYFTEKFGTYPKTAINFDPFGHSVGLVQIIKKCGQDGYMFMRPYDTELSLPAEVFVWRGLDGSEIKAARTGPYNTPLGQSASAIAERAASKDGDVCMVLWGVGNHGGGPSRKDLCDISEMAAKSDDLYIHSTPDCFFRKVNPTAVFEHSLRTSMPGCYSSMYRVKKKHALLESELSVTEKMLSTAYARGLLKTYPEDTVRTVTEDLLNAEFHDVLPGTCIQSGEDNGLKLLDHGLLEAERLKTRAYFALASVCAPAAEGEFPILVFNPHGYQVNENVECEFMLADQNWRTDLRSNISLRDEDGNNVPYQLIKEESNLNLDWRKRIIFPTTLSPFGFHRYSLSVTFEPTEPKPECDGVLVFDNGRKRVEIDRGTGLLKSYSINGKELVRDGFMPVSFSDNEDPWAMGAHQLKRLGQGEERPFTLSQTPDGPFAGMQSVQVVEDGDVYLGVEAFLHQDSTRVRLYYKIYKNNDFVDVDVTLFLSDVNRVIKLKLPTTLDTPRVLGQCAFGTEELFTDGTENVSHRFICITDSQSSVCLMNNGTYGSHFEGGALYTTLVRGVTYCAHPIEQRQLVPSDRYTKKIDQGESTFSFRLSPTAPERAERESEIFVQKPYALNIFPTATSARATADFKVSLSDETVALVTLKKADGKDALLLRLHNNKDTSAETTLTVDGASIALSFGKFEVKTVLYENGSLREECELII